jgi:hypothetical protein
MSREGREPGERATRLDRSWWLTLVAVAVPLAVGLAVLAQHTWYPIGDLGQANLRMLSFWSDPPLVGAAGRIAGEGGVQGNHPGPAQFWITWPVWALLGGSSWALNVAVAVANLAGAVVAVVCARRIGGSAAAGAIGAAAVVLVGGFGPEVMLQPWNPSMPLTWFLALVVAAWGVTTGRVGMLPVVAGAASYVVQCHTGYAPLALGLCALAGGWAVVDAVRAPERGAALRRVASWAGGAVLVAGLMWVPPVVDQLVHDPGNITILLYSFSHPDEAYVGLGRALRLTLLQLDPTGGALRGREAMDGTPVGGVLLLLAWVGTGVAAARTLPSTWRRLDVVLGAAVVGGWVSISRIFGLPFVYIYKWMWVLCALVVVATGAHVAALVRRRSERTVDRRALLAVVALATSVGLIVGVGRFSQAEVSGERYSDTVAGLIEPTEEALSPDEDYLVRWVDPAALGGVGFGMVLELERRGFDVGVDERFSAAAEPHRVRDEDDADAVVWVVSGRAAIEEALARPGARLVAEVDPRSEAEVRRRDELVARASDRLDAIGEPGLADQLRADGNLFAILLSGDLPDDVVADITELVELFLPTAVVVAPPGA